MVRYLNGKKPPTVILTKVVLYLEKESTVKLLIHAHIIICHFISFRSKGKVCEVP